MPREVTISECDATSIDDVRSLWREYWLSFGFDPQFQGFAAELDGLPGGYQRPGGALLVARVDGDAAGCIALRRLDDQRCEAKRLYVRPGYRGLGLGRQLLEAVIQTARDFGYVTMHGDTMPVMTDAMAMYQRFGFELCEPYSGKPTPGAIYYVLPLRAA